MRFLLSLLSAVGILGPRLPTSPTMTEFSFPSLPSDHPASIQFSAWLSAFNTADKEVLVNYHADSTFPSSILGAVLGSIDRELEFARMTGGFSIEEVESSSEPSSIVVILKEKARPQYARAAMVVDISQSSYPVTELKLRAIVTPIKFIPKDDPRWPQFERALAPLTTERRRAVLDGLSNVIRDQYINLELGEEIITALEAHFKDGDYEVFDQNEKFAQRLTEDMHLSGHDMHMGIRFLEPRPERNQSGDDPKPESRVDDLRKMNFGFGSVSFDTDSILGKKIATLPINGFVPSTPEFVSDWEDIQAAIGQIVSSVADADVLLIDLRSNHGGSPDTVAFILSYLIDGAPLHLLDMVDRSGSIEKSFSTTPFDQLPQGTERFGGQKPLFVLTTNETISGGEDMAYSLQAFKRANAIVGEGNEATASAANPITRPRFIGEEIFGKGWWFVAVPNLKPVHPITASNWEGVGVKSDVIAGKGEWAGVSDAEEVSRSLARRILESQKEL
jgi:Peptidase family S41/N-terminal domain of Peptidase_S41 in eukaryotic IRBP